MLVLTVSFTNHLGTWFETVKYVIKILSEPGGEENNQGQHKTVYLMKHRHQQHHIIFSILHEFTQPEEVLPGSDHTCLCIISRSNKHVGLI